MRGLVRVLVVVPLVLSVGLVGASADPLDEACGLLDRVELSTGEVLCTHGDDTRFAAAAADEPNRADRSVPIRRERCYGEGINGPRVQVLYVRGAEGRKLSSSLRANITRWVRQVEWTVSASAKRLGGRRHVRWVTTLGDDGRCVLDIRGITVADRDLSEFGRTVSALKDRGWDDPDRKYLLFVDSRAYCGLATAPSDDRPGSANRSERGAGYARVDRPCWRTGDRGFGSTAAHELMHTLGAVQDSAPHSTGAAHCTDEYDVMCYADGGAPVSVRCRDRRSATSGAGDRRNHLLDCGGDDYFHPAPASGSYLATHWNTAMSSFLARRGSDGPGHRGRRPDVERDPSGRLQTWNPVLGGAHRPLLPDAHGWEACELPIDVHVAADEDQGLAGLIERRRPDPVLEASVRGAIADINAGTGTTILRYAGLADGDASRGTIRVEWGEQSAAAAVEVEVVEVRIDAAVVRLSRPRFDGASDAHRTVFATHGLAQALGLGRVDAPPGDLMAAVPRADASARTAFAALEHLYGTSCTLDPRLDTVRILGVSVEPVVHERPASQPAPAPATRRVVRFWEGGLTELAIL